MVLVIREAFGVPHDGGAVVHVSNITWCSKFGNLENCRCTSVHFEAVSVDLSVSIA